MTFGANLLQQPTFKVGFLVLIAQYYIYRAYSIEIQFRRTERID